ncbi:MAG TPA: hypothetical protein VFK48_17120 [Usitatibacter sp.]|nr:hypothetical protein [Usitatibacter sp.]
MRAVSPDKLLQATTEEEVVELVRTFLAGWRPEELSEIPATCRPGKVRDAEDVGDLAYELTRARIAASGPQQLLKEMEVFFAQACARLSELEAAHSRQSRSRSSSSSSSSTQY